MASILVDGMNRSEAIESSGAISAPWGRLYDEFTSRENCKYGIFVVRAVRAGGDFSMGIGHHGCSADFCATRLDVHYQASLVGSCI